MKVRLVSHSTRLPLVFYNFYIFFPGARVAVAPDPAARQDFPSLLSFVQYAKGLKANSPAGTSYKEDVAVAFPMLSVPYASLKRCQVINHLRDALRTPGCKLPGFKYSPPPHPLILVYILGSFTICAVVQ